MGVETTSQPIVAHKAQLGVRSVYFRTMFTSGVGGGRAGPVVIRHTTPAVFRAILEYLYTDVAGPHMPLPSLIPTAPL
jgi:hypothetical protein